jgi:hypothetical protein
MSADHSSPSVIDERLRFSRLVLAPRVKRLLVSAILVSAGLIPTALSANAQSTTCTTRYSGDTSYTTCTQHPLPPSPTATPAVTRPDPFDVYIEERLAAAQRDFANAVAANDRYIAELRAQQAAALARQQPGDTGMTVYVYGKPVHHDFGAFFRTATKEDVFMVANGQLHYVHEYAYEDVGVAPDLSNVLVVTWMKSDMYGDPF